MQYLYFYRMMCNQKELPMRWFLTIDNKHWVINTSKFCIHLHAPRKVKDTLRSLSIVSPFGKVSTRSLDMECLYLYLQSSLITSIDRRANMQPCENMCGYVGLSNLRKQMSLLSSVSTCVNFMMHGDRRDSERMTGPNRAGASWIHKGEYTL